ncbi:LolA family protein [Thermus caldilimi]|uniref:LolA family protein n=1 Tax=Thermus caldilimi TaxID=2483360 RepID=UPI0010766DA4|nr:hypothetical protein [Thermus caldilimi]
MRKLLALAATLGLALALSPEEVWQALQVHAKVAGYLAQVRQGPVVYQVAFRRPWVRIDWLEGPDYLKGSALISDGQRAWSRAPKGPWQETKATPPDDPLQLLFTGFPEVQRDYAVQDPKEEGGLWRFLLVKKTPPKDDRQPAAWRIAVNPKGHLPFRYEVLSPSGKVLAQAEYLKLDPTPPPQSLFEVKP